MKPPDNRRAASTVRVRSSCSRRRLSVRKVRLASYEAAFQLLYMLEDPGVDGNDHVMMHEDLLGADPKRERRPARLRAVGRPQTRLGEWASGRQRQSRRLALALMRGSTVAPRST